MTSCLTLSNASQLWELETNSAVPPSDRRKFQRYPLDVDLTFRLLYAMADRRVFAGRTVNMSRGGLLFTTNMGTVLEIGDAIETQLIWSPDRCMQARLLVLLGTIVRLDENV